MGASPSITSPGNSMSYDPVFPFYPYYEGRCYEGTINIGQYYSSLGFDVRYALKGNPYAKEYNWHSWIFVDDQPVDYYQGRVDNSDYSYWKNPDQEFSSLDEFKTYIHDKTSIKLC